ncbi:MAG: hypothetical protein LBL71_03430, partial [Endomicrobium sp.]|nr:hypothetical protein [Endomicrobium sp.]
MKKLIVFTLFLSMTQTACVPMKAEGSWFHKPPVQQEKSWEDYTLREIKTTGGMVFILFITGAFCLGVITQYLM